MVFGAEGDCRSIHTHPAKSSDVMNFSRASLSVAESKTKGAAKACKFVKVLFLAFIHGQSSGKYPD